MAGKFAYKLIFVPFKTTFTISLRTPSFYYIISIYKIIVLPVVLYECETWSLTLREKQRLRVFEKQGAEENIWTEER
jgi:hypothetical protein